MMGQIRSEKMIRQMRSYTSLTYVILPARIATRRGAIRRVAIRRIAICHTSSFATHRRGAQGYRYRKGISHRCERERSRELVSRKSISEHVPHRFRRVHSRSAFVFLQREKRLGRSRDAL